MTMSSTLQRLTHSLWTLPFLLIPLSSSGQPLDAVFAVFEDNGQVCINDKQGSYSCSAIESSHSERLLAVALGDVNGDSITDAVFNVFEPFETGAVDLSPQVCLGSGTGAFDCG